MSMILLVAALVVLLGLVSLGLWVAWPTLSALRERQRVQVEVFQAQAQSRQLTSVALLRLLDEARRAQAEQPET